MPPKSKKPKNRQNKRKAKGLETSETTADLVEHLGAEEALIGQLPTPESQADTGYNAAPEIDSKEAVEKQVQHRHGETRSELKYYKDEKTRKEVYLALKPPGSSLSRIEARQRELDKRITSASQRAKSLKLSYLALEDYLTDLDVALEAYKVQRNRFISMYKRDKLGIMTEADQKFIGESNEGAYEGDAVTDASLYTGPDRRRDLSAFEKLYGFHPQIVLSMRRQETIDVLNTHARVHASKNETGSERFYNLFAEFVGLFRKSGYRESYLDGISTDVTKAYWAFVNSVGTEITRGEVND